MFELIVLGLILAGLAAISRAPVPNQQTETPTQPVPTLWSTQTNCHQFHKPTYLRRGVVLDDGGASSTPIREDICPSGAAELRRATGETP